MKYCYVDRVKDRNKTYYYLRTSFDLSIIAEPTKYLKHRTMEHCSPNTVRRIAYALSYYITYLKEQDLTMDQVLLMPYATQQEHFVAFLLWIKDGNHCDRIEVPNNNTCNSYLQSVFGYYIFVLLEYEKQGDIKVLEQRELSYTGRAGVRFRRSIMTFRGYLPKEESRGRIIEKGNIVKLLEATDNFRNQLLILILAETGFRIGEVLGIKYTKDIDFEQRTIKVTYREDNENAARAKNAEVRRAKISEETMGALQVYLSEYREELAGTDYLFITLFGETEGKPLTVNAVYSFLLGLEKKTGIKATPHMLRHYFANERREKGWKIEQISRALGHKHTATTEKYMHITDDEMAAAMDTYYEQNGGFYDIGKLI